MKAKWRRFWMIAALMLGVGTATALLLAAFRENLVFLYAPTAMLENHIPPGRRFRLGGLVAPGSVVRATDGVSIRFTVTDLVHEVPVMFKGVLPDLFREGQGVVAEGALDGSGGFMAVEVLARHDERYMPAGVAEALKKSGQWHDPKASKNTMSSKMP